MLLCKGCGREDFANQTVLEVHEREYCPALQNGNTEKKVDKVRQRPTMVGRLQIPTPDPHYLIDDVLSAEVDRVLELTEKSPQNLALIGPKGTGKTALAMQIAAKRKSPMYLGNAYAWRSSDEVFGQEKVSLEVGTYYDPALFVEAIEQPGATVVINDFALMQNKSVQNGLNDLLDENIRYAWVDQITHTLGRPIRVAERVLIIATWNEGTEYTGNVKLSANILDRFTNRIYMGYPPSSAQIEVLIRKTGIQHANAQRLCRFGDILRNLDEPIEVSMRGLLQAARKLVMGANIRDALAFTVISGLPVDVQEKAMIAMEDLYEAEEKEEIAERDERNEWTAWEVRYGDEGN